MDEAQVETVKKVVGLVEAGKPLSPEETQQALTMLEDYECWAPFFTLIQKILKDPKRRQAHDYIRLARVQYLFLEDVFACAETCAQAVATLNINFRDFVESFLPNILEKEDWTSEATILQAVYEKFALKADQVLAMERLCLLFEKKTFNEVQLNESYSRLLQMEPTNVKALRYFKLVFTQNYEWEKVVSVLRSLIQASKHPRDVFRVAQELAAVLLYQLDQPREAIKVIEKYCEGSPLDSSTIHYDAYQRLGDWSGCLRVLRECLLSVSDDAQRAVIHYQIGQLEEKAGQKDAAVKEFEKAVQANPTFYEAHECLVNASLAQKDWTQLLKRLENFSNQISDDTLRLQLSEVCVRLREGLERGSSASV